MKPQLLGFHHIAIIASNYARSKHFYMEILGAKLAFKVENIDSYIAYLLEKGISCEPIRVDELTRMKYTFLKDPDALPIELYETNN